MIEILVITIFPTLVILAAVNDLFTFAIPNWISAALVTGFAVMAVLCGLPLEAVGSHVLTGTCALIIGFGLFCGGYVGGGDAKFFAATALWLGWPVALTFVLLMAIFGGVLAMAILSIRRFPLPVLLASQGWVERLTMQGGGIPYGIAIGAAAMVSYSSSVWMMSEHAGHYLLTML